MNNYELLLIVEIPDKAKVYNVSVPKEMVVEINKTISQKFNGSVSKAFQEFARFYIGNHQNLEERVSSLENEFDLLSQSVRILLRQRDS